MFYLCSHLLMLDNILQCNISSEVKNHLQNNTIQMTKKELIIFLLSKKKTLCLESTFYTQFEN